MHSIIRYFISVGLLLGAFYSLAQTKDAPKKIPKPKKDFTPTGIRLGTDLIDFGKTFTGKTFQGWEVNGDVGLANYYLAADIGSWSKNVAINNGSYNNGGMYYRVGVDINLLGKDPDKNMVFFGLRYGHSLFHDSLTYHSTPAHLFPASTYKLGNGNVSGHWGELTSGLRVKVWRGLWMGYTARMKFSPSTRRNDPSMASYDMPGYGLVSNNLWWGFNYQVFWKFSWRKDKPVKK